VGKGCHNYGGEYIYLISMLPKIPCISEKWITVMDDPGKEK